MLNNHSLTVAIVSVLCCAAVQVDGAKPPKKDGGGNHMAFCKEFNAATQKQAGDILPVVITVFKDKSFTFITKSPPAAVLLKKAANIAAGSKEPNKTKVGKVSRKQVMDIVNTKRKDLNARDDEGAFRIISGTARQMGLEVVD